jgi:hypothetical protein
MKQQSILGFIIIAISIFAQPHPVYIEVWDCNSIHIPDGDVYYEAVIIERPEEIVTQETFGWEYSGVIEGYISGNLGNGFSSWNVGETLEITLTQISTDFSVTNSWVITNAGYEQFPNPGGLELILGEDCVSSSEVTEIASINTLSSNFPNPFNPITDINFSVKGSETGILTIYNAKGQVVENKKFTSGVHSYTWNADKYSSGIYFYKLQTESFSEVKKMLMLK